MGMRSLCHVIGIWLMPRSQISRRPYDVPTSANVDDVCASGRHRGTAEGNSWHRVDIVRLPDGNRTDIGRCLSRCGPKCCREIRRHPAGVRWASVRKSADSLKGIPRWSTNRTIVAGSSAGRRGWSGRLLYDGRHENLFARLLYYVNIFHKISDQCVTHITVNPPQRLHISLRRNRLVWIN